MLYQGHKCLGGIKHFWMAVRVWKTNLVVKDLACQKHEENVTKVRDLVRSDRRLKSEWSVVCWIWIAKPSTTQKKGSSCPARDYGHLDTASRQCSLSHCHLRERIFGQKSISVVPQPPYSPDLSPYDFFLFPKLKFHLKGRHFGTVDNIQKVVTDQLRALLHEDFQHCYREWEQRLRRCVASQGNYFEGDNVEL